MFYLCSKFRTVKNIKKVKDIQYLHKIIYCTSKTILSVTMKCLALTFSKQNTKNNWMRLFILKNFLNLKKFMFKREISDIFKKKKCSNQVHKGSENLNKQMRCFYFFFPPKTFGSFRVDLLFDAVFLKRWLNNAECTWYQHDVFVWSWDFLFWFLLCFIQ